MKQELLKQYNNELASEKLLIDKIINYGGNLECRQKLIEVQKRLKEIKLLIDDK